MTLILLAGMYCIGFDSWKGLFKKSRMIEGIECLKSFKGGETKRNEGVITFLGQPGSLPLPVLGY